MFATLLMCTSWIASVPLKQHAVEAQLPPGAQNANCLSLRRADRPEPPSHGTSLRLQRQFPHPRPFCSSCGTGRHQETMANLENERRPIAPLGKLPQKRAGAVPLRHVPLLVAIRAKTVPHESDNRVQGELKHVGISLPEFCAFMARYGDQPDSCRRPKTATPLS